MALEDDQEPEKEDYERRGGRIVVRLAHQEGQVGHRSSHGHLEQRLRVAEIAGLTNAQLGQSSGSVFGHLATGAVVPVARGGLEGARFLEQPFLGMEGHTAATASTHTLRAERTGATHRSGEVEGAAPVRGRSEIIGRLTGRAGAGPSF